MATEQNFGFQLGETWTISFELNDSVGDDIDLTGATITFALADFDGVVLSIDTDGDDVVIDSPAPVGMGVIVVEPDDQMNLEPGSYNYELRAALGDGQITVQAFGKIIVGASLLAWPAPTSP